MKSKRPTTISLFAAAVLVLLFCGGAATAQGAGKEIKLEPLFSISCYTGLPDFKSPDAFFFDSAANRIYLADSNELRLYIFDVNGVPVSTYEIDRKAIKIRSLIAFREKIYVLHDEGIMVFDQRSEKQSDVPGTAAIFKKNAFDKFVLDGRGTAYVKDGKNDLIYKYGVGGEEPFFNVMREENKNGEGKEKRFKGMRDIHVDMWDSLYVLYAGNEKMEKYDSSGRFRGNLLKRFSLSEADLFNPKLVVTDASKRFYIYDEGDRAIKIFDEAGFFKGSIGAFDTAGGERFLFPKQLYVDGLDRLYVLDEGDRRLKAFQIRGFF